MEAVLDSMGLEHPANLHCVKEHSSTFSGFSLPMLIISVKYVRFTEPSISERAFFFYSIFKGGHLFSLWICFACVLSFV